MPRIRLERVTKVYDGDVLAVDDVSLEVADGEFMVLVGPSGCGKSTLLRMIAGLEKVTLGQVWIGDDDVTTLEPPDRDIAMVFQSYALYPHKTSARTSPSGCDAARCRRTRSPSEWTGWRRCSGSASCWSASRRRSPAVSDSASRWAGRSSGSHAPS